MATYLFWDPVEDNIVQERDETGALAAEYTTEPGLFGNVISQTRSGEDRQFHYDAQGSMLAITDANEQSVDTRAYSAFGETTDATGNTESPFGYIGQRGYYGDKLMPHYIVRHRIYAPSLARWTSIDPMLYSTLIRDRISGTSGYTYTANNPLAIIDPSGEQGIAASWADEVPEAPAQKCNCDEDQVFVSSIPYYHERLDVELHENIDPAIDAIKNREFGRKTPVGVGVMTVKSLYVVKNYRITCCKKDGTFRVLQKTLLRDDYVKILSINISTPPGPPTTANMKKIAECAHPLPFVLYSEGDDKAKCIKESFSDVQLGPRKIAADADLDKCAAK